MEIDEFIEQDILVFLDERLDKAEAAVAMRKAAFTPTIFITHDYEKELNAALDQQNLVEAKKVLAALKQQFDDCPTGTQDKQQLKALLIMLYDRFKDQLDVQNSFARIDAQVPTRQAQRAPVPPVAAPAQQIPAQPMQPSAPIPMSSEPPAPRMEDFAYLVPLLDAIDTQLAKDDIKAAASAYKKAKDAAAKSGALPLPLSLRYLTLFGRIKQALVDAKYAEAAAAPTAPAASAMPAIPTTSVTRALPSPASPVREKSAASAMDQHLLLQMEQEKRTLDALLKGNDIAASIRQYKKMRLLAQQLHGQKSASEAKEKLTRMHALIERLRQHPSLDEHGLVAVP